MKELAPELAKELPKWFKTLLEEVRQKTGKNLLLGLTEKGEKNE